MLFVFYGCNQIKEPKIVIYNNYWEGLKFAKINKMRIFLAFDSHNNPVKWTTKILNHAEIQSELNNYVVIHLKVDGGDINSKEYAELQIEKFKVNYQPCYFIINENEEIIKGPLGYSSVEHILEFIIK